MAHILKISLTTAAAQRLDTLSLAKGRSPAEVASEILTEKLVPREPGLGSRIAAIWADADAPELSLNRDRTAYLPPDV